MNNNCGCEFDYGTDPKAHPIRLPGIRAVDSILVVRRGLGGGVGGG